MLKSCRLQWEGHIAQMGGGRRTHKRLLGKPGESTHMVGRKLGGRIRSFEI